MKEYICKDDLKGLNQYAYGVEEIIADIPTVTKADICKEFAEKLKPYYFGDRKGLIHTADIEKVLAEMEEE